MTQLCKCIFFCFQKQKLNKIHILKQSIFNIPNKILRLPKTKCSLKCIAARFCIGFTMCNFRLLQLCGNIWVNRPNVRRRVQRQMQSLAVGFVISFTLCSLTAIAAINCSSYVPTFGLIGQMFVEVCSCKCSKLFSSFHLLQCDCNYSYKLLHLKTNIWIIDLRFVEKYNCNYSIQFIAARFFIVQCALSKVNFFYILLILNFVRFLFFQ